jgi:hypothetical protein
MLVLALSVLLVQQPAVAQPSPRPVRIVISPENPVVIAEDTLRLRARVYDAGGTEVRGARVRFVPAGGRFEGDVDPTGLVQSGSTGTLPVTVVAQVDGHPPVTERVEVKMVAGPAARIVVAAAPGRLVAGQRVRLDASAFSAAGDKRTERRDVRRRRRWWGACRARASPPKRCGCIRRPGRVPGHRLGRRSHVHDRHLRIPPSRW